MEEDEYYNEFDKDEGNEVNFENLRAFEKQEDEASENIKPGMDDINSEEKAEFGENIGDQDEEDKPGNDLQVRSGVDENQEIEPEGEVEDDGDFV